MTLYGQHKTMNVAQRTTKQLDLLEFFFSVLTIKSHSQLKLYYWFICT